MNPEGPSLPPGVIQVVKQVEDVKIKIQTTGRELAKRPSGNPVVTAFAQGEKNARKALQFTIMSEPTRIKKAEILRQAMISLAQELKNGRMTQATFNKRMKELVAMDPSVGQDKKTNYQLIAKILGAGLDSTDPDISGSMQDVYNCCSENLMKKLGYVDIKFCPPTRMANYIASAAFAAENTHPEPEYVNLGSLKLQDILLHACTRCEEEAGEEAFSDELRIALIDRFADWDYGMRLLLQHGGADAAGLLGYLGFDTENLSPDDLTAQTGLTADPQLYE